MVWPEIRLGGVCEPGFALPAEPLIKLTDKWQV